MVRRRYRDGGIFAKGEGVPALESILAGNPTALTDTEIRQSRPGDKPCKLSDNGGLHLSVTLTGAKIRRWKYRFEGTEKLIALGC
jgi:hypothetical protein